MMDKPQTRLPKKSYEIRFNQVLNRMELVILDAEGMFPLVVRDPKTVKIYQIDCRRTSSRKPLKSLGCLLRAVDTYLRKFRATVASPPG